MSEKPEERTVEVNLEALLYALDALDKLPDANQTDWYASLNQSAELAFQSVAIEKGLIPTH